MTCDNHKIIDNQQNRSSNHRRSSIAVRCSSIASRRDADDLMTDTVVTLGDRPTVVHGNDNLKFRLSPQSCKIIGSVPRKKSLTFDFTEPCAPNTDVCLQNDAIVSPTVMVIESLKCRLLKCHKCLVAKAKAQDCWALEEQETVDCTEELHALFNMDFSNLGADESINIIVANKKISLAFQQLVWTCWLDRFPGLSKSILNGIRKLMSHPLGNYVLKKIIEKDIQARNATETICREDFEKLCTDQYASRVIQTLIESSASFRQFSTDYFRHNAWRYVDSMPAVYLLVAVIDCSEEDAEIDFVRQMIAEGRNRLAASKYAKRVVVAYLLKVADVRLQEVFKLFDFNSKGSLLKLFNEKFASYILLTFVCREFEPAIDLLAGYIETSLNQLLRTKHFMFILTKLMTVGGFKDKSHPHNRRLIDPLIKAVCRHSAKDLKNQRFAYLCYVLLAQSKIVAKESLGLLIAFLEKELENFASQAANYQFNMRKASTL